MQICINKSKTDTGTKSKYTSITPSKHKKRKNKNRNKEQQQQKRKSITTLECLVKIIIFKYYTKTLFYIEYFLDMSLALNYQHASKLINSMKHYLES